MNKEMKTFLNHIHNKLNDWINRISNWNTNGQEVENEKMSAFENE